MFDKVLFGLVRLPMTSQVRCLALNQFSELLLGALIVESLTPHLSNDETHRCMEGWAVPSSLL